MVVEASAAAAVRRAIGRRKGPKGIREAIRLAGVGAFDGKRGLVLGVANRRSIAGFPTMEAIVEERAPLHRHIDADDVGAAAAFLLSDAARNVTGTTLYVDSGYHAMGM